MLSDVQIEKYLYKYAQRHNGFNITVGQIIADRVGKNMRITSVNTPYTLTEAFKKEQDLNKIRKARLELITTQVSELGKDLHNITHLIYNDSKADLNDTNNFLIPKSIKSEIEKAKLGLLALISKPMFFVNNKKYTPEELYSTIVNDAFLNYDMSGIKAIRNALMRFRHAGSMFEYTDTETNTKRLTSAINTLRMSVLNSIKTIIEKTTNYIAKKLKSNGIELSAHICPAPDHAPVQGRQFSNEEFAKMQSGASFVDVKGNVYQGFQRPIFAWNCRHYTKPIRIGLSKPEHTEEELQKILDDNERGYTTADGRHYTLYECTQIQRGYERKIRKAKEDFLLSKGIRDNTEMNIYKGKVIDLTTQYKAFSEACGLPVMYDRIRVQNY